MWMCLKAVLYPPSGDLVCAKGEENPVGWWPVVGIPIPFIYRICIPNKNISKSATIFAWMTYVVVFLYSHQHSFWGWVKNYQFSWGEHHLPSLNQHPCTIHLPTPLAGISIIYHLPSNLSSYYQHIYICICIYIYIYVCKYICVYVYVYVYVYAYVYIYIYICVYVYVYVYVYAYVYIYVCICICIYVYVYVYVYIYMYMYMYAYTYMYMYMYIYMYMPADRKPFP